MMGTLVVKGLRDSESVDKESEDELNTLDSSFEVWIRYKKN